MAEKENSTGVAKALKAKPERIDLPIVGMSCASCASTIQKGLVGLDGVEKANVNFANSKATVFFQPQLAKPEDFISSVRKSGYEVGTASLELPIQGIECASCVQKIEKAILQSRGVVKAVVNLATAKAKVEYLPSETNLEEIKRAVESTGYKVLEFEPSEEIEDPERLVREKEYKKLKTKFIVGLILAIFVLSLTYYPYFLLAASLAFILGLVMSPIIISCITLIHRSSQNQMMGRIFSSLDIVCYFAFILFMFLSSLLADWVRVPANYILQVVSYSLILLGLLNFIFHRKISWLD